MKPRYYHKIPFDFFSGKTMLVVLLIFVSSLSFILGYYVGKGSTKFEAVVSDSPYEIKETEEKARVENKDIDITVKDENIIDEEPKGIAKDATAQAKEKTEEKESLKVKEQIKHQRLSQSEKAQKVKKSQEDRAQKNIYYSIQVGAFKSKAQAEGFSKKLDKKGYHVYISESSKRNLYKVRLGRFETREEAKDFLKKLKERERLDGIVVRSEG